MESKIDATDRLRREGRWNEASAFRDEERKRLKTEGLGRQEANEQAWTNMIEKYPPIEPPASAKPAEPQDISEFFQTDEADPDLVRDILWCYSHLDRRQVNPGNAPSAGAWHLLVWARDNRDRFFEVMLPKAMPKDNQSGLCPECEERRKDNEQTERLINQCLQFEGPDAERLRREALEERRLDKETIVCPNCQARVPLTSKVSEVLTACRLRELARRLESTTR